MRRNMKAIHRLTGETVYEAHQCGDCGAIYERIPRSGELWVCGECRTVEGKWTMVWADESGEKVYAEMDNEVEVAS